MPSTSLFIFYALYIFLNLLLMPSKSFLFIIDALYIFFIYY